MKRKFDSVTHKNKTNKKKSPNKSKILKIRNRIYVIESIYRFILLAKQIILKKIIYI